MINSVNEFSVIFLIGGLDAGGSERQLLYLCKSLKVQAKVRPIVINWAGTENDFFYNEFIKSNINVVCLGHIHNKLERFFVLKKNILIIKPKVLHSFSFYLNFLATVCCFGTSIRAFGALRSSYNLLKESSSKLSIFINIFFCELLITNSVSAKQEVRNRFWYRFKRIEVLDNHIPIPGQTKFSKLDKRNSNSYLQSLSVGRCDNNKRINLIINIIHKLKESDIPIIHTHLGNGILISELTDLVNRLGIEENFKFVGRVENVEDYMLDSDFLIHTAESEGSPNVVIEAMSLGLVVLTTNSGDLPFLIDNNVDGIIVSGSEIEDLICKKIQVLSLDECERIKIGKRAVMKIKNNFDSIFYCDKVMELYITD